MAVFRLEQVGVTRYSGAVASHLLSDVNVEIPPGQCTVVVGPSGAGKSTLLRLLNRLEDPTTGRLFFHEQPIAGYHVLELRRRVGLVQQTPVLLADSVLADLRVAAPRLTPGGACELLARVGLAGEFSTRATDELSGGEAQRVCLARALALAPDVLLLDEPTSALDAFAAQTVEHAVRGLTAQGLTTVVVAHDLQQAARLADVVVVLIAGEVADVGPARRVFGQPGSAAARLFLAGVSPAESAVPPAGQA